MKQLTANQWRNLLYKFTADNDFRPGIQKPFEQGDYVCATDAYIVLRVHRNLIPEGHDYAPKAKVPDVAKVMPDPDPTFSITLENLRDCLATLGLDYDHLARSCPECGGSGDVDWYYTDREGNTHSKVDGCPCCNGTGEVHNGNDCFCTISNRATIAYLMILVHYAMVHLGVDKLKCTWGIGCLMLNLADGVDILVGTMPIPASKRSHPIEFTDESSNR